MYCKTTNSPQTFPPTPTFTPITVHVVCSRSLLQEIGELRSQLNGEVDTLKSEFLELKVALRQQLELTEALVQVGAGCS